MQGGSAEVHGSVHPNAYRLIWSRPLFLARYSAWSAFFITVSGIRWRAVRAAQTHDDVIPRPASRAKT